MAYAMVWPCAGPSTRVCRISMSSVPWISSPCSGGAPRFGISGCRAIILQKIIYGSVKTTRSPCKSFRRGCAAFGRKFSQKTVYRKPVYWVDRRSMPHSFSEALAGIVLPDADGRQVRLGSLWDGQPAVLVFLRHYG